MKRLDLMSNSIDKYFTYIYDYEMKEFGDYYIITKPDGRISKELKSSIPLDIFALNRIYTKLPENLKYNLGWAPVYTDINNQLVKVKDSELRCPFISYITKIVNKINWGYEINGEELLVLKKYNCIGEGQIEELPTELISVVSIDLDNYIKSYEICYINGTYYKCPKDLYLSKVEEIIDEILCEESFFSRVKNKLWQQVLDVLFDRSLVDVDGNIIKLGIEMTSKDIIKLAYINNLNSNYNHRLKKEYKDILDKHNIRLKNDGKVIEHVNITNPTHGRLQMVEYDSKDFNELVSKAIIVDMGNHYKIVTTDSQYLMIKDGESADIFRLNAIHKKLKDDLKSLEPKEERLYCNCKGNLILSDKYLEPSLFGKYIVQAIVKNFKNKKLTEDELFVIDYHEVDLTVPPIKYGSLDRMEQYKYRISGSKLENGARVLHCKNKENNQIIYFENNSENVALAIKYNIIEQLAHSKAFNKLKADAKIEVEQLCLKAINKKEFTHKTSKYLQTNINMKDTIALQFALYLNFKFDVPYTEEVIEFAKRNKINLKEV